jgi:hypothetical protein
MAGLKTLAKELQSKGRNGDTILAHINPQEAGILKALGGSGTINPSTGLPEYFKIGNPFKPVTKAIGQLNPLNPGSSLSKTINTTPVVGDVNKALNKVGTQIFQPIEKAIVQPASRGLASFDKAVGNTIPGGWSTVGQIALSAMGAPVPLQVAYGAARGSGVMRKGGNFNLQGAVIGGATAYATAQLGDYMRGASDAAIEAGEQGLTEAVAREAAPITDYSQSLTPPPPPITAAPPISYDPGYYDINPNLPSTYNPAPDPSFLSKVGTKIGDAIAAPVKFVADIPTTGVSEAGETFSGIKNLTGFGDVTAKEAAAQAAKTGIKALPMTALALYGETSLSGLDEQRKYLEESKRTNAINQAEYDSALAEINRQRDYAQSVVNQSPFSSNPSRDVSIGETFYGRSGEGENLYDRMQGNLYAMGGQIDDESGMDEVRGMMQGNLQKGLFGMGYAAGGQIDMGNGYNPFANLPIMSGPLGAAGQLPTAQTQPSFARSPYGIGPSSVNTTTEQDMTGGNRNGISGGLSNIFGQPSSPFYGDSNQQASYPSLNQNPNTNMGGFAGPSQFYGGGGSFGGSGGSGGAFPLEGQYGIVKMAAGGMPPRFLSGGGDGMSDSIKATINDNQPARLADGEFVIPADVVSHLGNGSSKAGAKQLYSMMDKVRKARTGNPKQGKQINPRKYMPA